MAGRPTIAAGDGRGPGSAAGPGAPGPHGRGGKPAGAPAAAPPCPVRVEVSGGTEVLRYREADMAMGELYRFRWHGEEFAALRSEEGVELLKFVPDEG